MASGTIYNPNKITVKSYYVGSSGTVIRHTTLPGQIVVIATRVIDGANYGTGMWIGWDNQNSSSPSQSWLVPIYEAANNKLTVALTPGELSITTSTSYT